MSTNSKSEESKLSSWLEQKNFGRHALGSLKTGLAAVLCVWLGDRVGLIHSYWAAVSAIVVMGFDNTLTFASCRDRVLGTAIGAFLGWCTCYIWHGHYLVYGLAVALCIFVCSAFAFDKAGRLAAVTLTIIVLIKIDAVERVDAVIGKRPRHLGVEMFYDLPLGEDGLYLDGVAEL